MSNIEHTHVKVYEDLMSLIGQIASPPPRSCGKCGTPDAVCDTECAAAAEWGALKRRIDALVTRLEMKAWLWDTRMQDASG